MTRRHGLTPAQARKLLRLIEQATEAAMDFATDFGTDSAATPRIERRMLGTKRRLERYVTQLSHTEAYGTVQ